MNRRVMRELDVIVRLHRDNVWEQVASGMRQALDDEFERVGVLDARDRDVHYLVDDEGRITLRMSFQRWGTT